MAKKHRVARLRVGVTYDGIDPRAVPEGQNAGDEEEAARRAGHYTRNDRIVAAAEERARAAIQEEQARIAGATALANIISRLDEQGYVY